MNYLILLTTFVLYSCNFSESPKAENPMPSSKNLPTPSVKEKEDIDKEEEEEEEEIVEKIIHFQDEMNSKNKSSPLLLGDLSTDSSVHIKLKLNRRWGECYILSSIKNNKDVCSLRRYWPEPLLQKKRKFHFIKDLNGEFSRLELLIGNVPFRLQELLDHDLASIFWREEFLHIVIKDIFDVKPIFSSNEDRLFFRIVPFNKSALEEDIFINNGPHYPVCVQERSYFSHFSVWVLGTIIHRIN